MAKLHMHTDLTLDILDQLTCDLGNEFRNFANEICPAFDTRELAREVEARKRRQMNKKKAQPVSTRRQPGAAQRNNEAVAHADNGSAGPETTVSGCPEAEAAASTRLDNGARPKLFNLHTYKFHALGDYARTIRRFGSMDSYSTEPVSIYKYDG
jgi:hypothetical protein